MKTSLAKASLFFSMALVSVAVPSLPNLVSHDRGLVALLDRPDRIPQRKQLSWSQLYLYGSFRLSVRVR